MRAADMVRAAGAAAWCQVRPIRRTVVVTVVNDRLHAVRQLQRQENVAGDVAGHLVVAACMCVAVRSISAICNNGLMLMRRDVGESLAFGSYCFPARAGRLGRCGGAWSRAVLVALRGLA